MARKFKVGDTVEVVPGAEDVPPYFKVGRRGKIIRYNSGDIYPYRVERKNGNMYAFSARELKLIRRGTKNGTN